MTPQDQPDEQTEVVTASALSWLANAMQTAIEGTAGQGVQESDGDSPATEAMHDSQARAGWNLINWLGQKPLDNQKASNGASNTDTGLLRQQAMTRAQAGALAMAARQEAGLSAIESGEDLQRALNQKLTSIQRLQDVDSASSATLDTVMGNENYGSEDTIADTETEDATGDAADSYSTSTSDSVPTVLSAADFWTTWMHNSRDAEEQQQQQASESDDVWQLQVLSQTPKVLGFHPLSLLSSMLDTVTRGTRGVVQRFDFYLEVETYDEEQVAEAELQAYDKAAEAEAAAQFQSQALNRVAKVEAAAQFQDQQVDAADSLEAATKATMLNTWTWMDPVHSRAAVEARATAAAAVDRTINGDDVLDAVGDNFTVEDAVTVDGEDLQVSRDAQAAHNAREYQEYQQAQEYQDADDWLAALSLELQLVDDQTGVINWSLILLIMLLAGTAGMLIGMRRTWQSLRRTVGGDGSRQDELLVPLVFEQGGREQQVFVRFGASVEPKNVKWEQNCLSKA
eukprot:CAMPEP_0119106688 /NCGR_PEP_ID=MMETSP1180-20130426/6063_1 /TAXON_ID=3052 ORGANISM="Chlamydomonas cf sp, Strain CCMP681" /NCGR_SAMPLE_ID=MMETSP1180 /ASSEMBLY_ACC=CAM_ASM_000741 /LENGTH=511 /DNA_ID=CAMNT_0007092065 /DNA_START=162 /DNA_END=1697 /DNA_ORIENTATION=+